MSGLLLDHPIVQRKINGSRSKSSAINGSTLTKRENAGRHDTTKPVLAKYLAGHDHRQGFRVTQHGVDGSATFAQTGPEEKRTETANPCKSNRDQPCKSKYSVERWVNEYDQYQDFLVTRHGFAHEAK